MSNPDGELTVAQRLGRALDRGLLPAGGPAEAAERLIERLERPARIALLGLPGAGKSSILNLLVGTVLVPETLRLPTIIVQHGDVARMVCTLTDGTTKVLPGSDLAEVLPLAPALVTLEMDLPALRVISLLEVSAGPMEAEQKRAATWASKRSDIVIWCTTSYLPKEQAVWESLPDAVKDNSFMFLTKVDLLGSRASALAMHDRVELRAGEEFRQILSISAKQARAATPPGGTVNRELFRDSGASAVITAIKTRVQSGRRADMDTAELLLARHVEASELVAKRFAEEEGEAPRAWTPPPDPVAAPVVEPEPVPDAPHLVEAPAPMVEPEPAAEPEFEDQASEAEPVAAAEDQEPPEAAIPDTTEPITPSAPEPEPPSLAPEPDVGTRRRFADRIKRVAADGDAAATPAVPLRTTWKSKAETEAPPPAPAPEPEAPRDETSRRPRASAAAPLAEEPTSEPAEESAPPDEESERVSVEPAADEPPVAEEPGENPGSPAVSEAVDVPEEATPRQRPARMVTPTARPDEAPRSLRPQLFGGRRPAAPGRDAPLPDLSALRATPEEMEAALEEEAKAAAEGRRGAAEEPEPSEPAPAPERTADRSPEPEAPAARPRLFDRPPVAVGSPPEPTAVQPDPAPRATPSTRLPRMAVTAAPAPVPPAPPEDQFSPRAIMRREPKVEADAPTPRRERPRIAARVMPVAAAPVASAPIPDVEQHLVDEALGVIVARSTDLAAEIDPEAKAPVDLILDHVRETGEQVQSVVSRGLSEELRRINVDLGEVMDLITLMQLEKGHAPADDALTLLLQLKRELETLRAA